VALLLTPAEVHWRPVRMDSKRPAGGARITRLQLEPTAIVCVNDFMAVGVLRELARAGLAASPKDIPVTGFDNIRLAEFALRRSLRSTSRANRLAHIMSESLVRTQETRVARGEVVIDPQFMVRESTSLAPQK